MPSASRVNALSLPQRRRGTPIVSGVFCPCTASARSKGSGVGNGPPHSGSSGPAMAESLERICAPRSDASWSAFNLVLHSTKALDADRHAALTQESSAFPERHKAEALTRLAGIGQISAIALDAEVFHRRFQSRKHLASYLGLAPTPYASGDSERDQGISKAGNQPARTLLVELAWCWLRHQPDSSLAQWYRRRFGEHGKRARKVGIVALARKLAIALWRFVETGLLPEGARLSPQ